MFGDQFPPCGVAILTSHYSPFLALFPCYRKVKEDEKIQIRSQTNPSRVLYNPVLTLSAGRCSSLFLGFSFDFDRGEDPSTSIPSSSDPSSDSESDSTSSFVSGMIGWIGHALSFESSPPVRRILFCSVKCLNY